MAFDYNKRPTYIADPYYGTECPEEVRYIFEFLGVEVKYEVSKFRNLDRIPRDKKKYWTQRASAILELSAITKIRRE
jgi:hypothetical protein